MHRLSYSLNPEALTFSTQCPDCNIPLVIRGYNDGEGIRLVEQCGCNYSDPTTTTFDTGAELQAAFDSKTSTLVAEVTASAQAYAENYVPPVEGEPAAWNDQRPSREMVAALLEMSLDNLRDGQVLSAEDLARKYPHAMLAQLVCSRAELARRMPMVDRPANQGMIAVLATVSDSDTAEGRTLAHDEMKERYTALELAEMVCARANAARLALVEPTVVLAGRR